MSSKVLVLNMRSKRHSLDTSSSHVDVPFFVFLFWFPSIMAFKSVSALSGNQLSSCRFPAGCSFAKTTSNKPLEQKSRSPFCETLAVRLRVDWLKFHFYLFLNKTCFDGSSIIVSCKKAIKKLLRFIMRLITAITKAKELQRNYKEI